MFGRFLTRKRMLRNIQITCKMKSWDPQANTKLIVRPKMKLRPRSEYASWSVPGVYSETISVSFIHFDTFIAMPTHQRVGFINVSWSKMRIEIVAICPLGRPPRPTLNSTPLDHWVKGNQARKEMSLSLQRRSTTQCVADGVGDCTRDMMSTCLLQEHAKFLIRQEKKLRAKHSRN